MLDTIRQWVLVLAAGAVALPLGAWARWRIEGLDGAPGSPLLLSRDPLSAWPTAGLLVIVAAGLGLLAGRLSHRYTGAFVFGLGLVFLAGRSISVDDALRMVNEAGEAASGLFVRFAIEGVLWALPAALVVAVLHRIAPTRYEDEAGPLEAPSPTGLAGGLLLGTVLSWVLLASPARGQAVGGTLAAMAATAMIVRLASPRCSGSVLFAIPLVLAVLAPVSAMFMAGDDALVDLARGRPWRLGHALPIDWVAAGMMGISLGIALARSFSPEHPPATTEEPTPAAPPATSTGR